MGIFRALQPSGMAMGMWRSVKMGCMGNQEDCPARAPIMVAIIGRSIRIRAKEKDQERSWSLFVRRLKRYIYELLFYLFNFVFR